MVVRGKFGSMMAMAFAGCLCVSGGSAAAAGGKAKPPRTVGLGAVLTSQDGEQIFGFDIDQAGRRRRARDRLRCRNF